MLAALLYYREHRAEIDAQDAEEIRLWNEMRAKFRKLNLRYKLA